MIQPETKKEMVDIIGNEELLKLHGHYRLNDFRTIQQAWNRLNSTPYHPSKAPDYARLRQIMLKIHQEKGGNIDGR